MTDGDTTESGRSYINHRILVRFDELISEGEKLWDEFRKNKNGMYMDIVGITQWTTSCLNLLDKLSVNTNRFVTQFEIGFGGGAGQRMNVGAALGVLKSARIEYSRGLAVDYHLSVTAAVFGGLLDEASYLMTKGYDRAAAVLIGAALEEGLKSRARAAGVDIGQKDTLNPVIAKLKAHPVGIITEFEAKRLKAISRLRNDAAHGGALTTVSGTSRAHSGKSRRCSRSSSAPRSHETSWRGSIRPPKNLGSGLTPQLSSFEGLGKNSRVDGGFLDENGKSDTKLSPSPDAIIRRCPSGSSGDMGFSLSESAAFLHRMEHQLYATRCCA